MKFWVVDSFAKKSFTGNPAAVFVVEDFFEDVICQQMAKELNLSETAFVKILNPNHAHIRWFTPKVEVKLCGHATLASAHVLYEQGLFLSEEIVFESLSGPLTIKQNYPQFTLDFPLQAVNKPIELDTNLLKGLGKIINSAMALDDIIIEIESENMLKAYQPDISLLNQIDCRGIIITAKSQKYDFVSRFFAPRVGVNEDPVTGSAHCKLADYWQKKLNKGQFRAYQLSERGGEINIQIRNNRVLLTGTACTIFEGKWLAEAK